MKGKLTISRSSDKAGKSMIHLRLEDELSGVEFVDIKLKPEQLALALTNLSHQECDFSLRGLAFIGKRREYKEEIVTIPCKEGSPTLEQKRAAVAPFEVGGWVVHDDYMIGNHHYRVGKPEERKYRVSFIRFVQY